MEYSQPQDQKIIITLFFSNPRNTARIRFDEEVDIVEKERRNAQAIGSKFKLVPYFNVSKMDFSRALTESQPYIIHFSGHGTDSGELMLTDTQGNSSAMSIGSLATLVKVLKGKIKCVVLNCCNSSGSAKLLVENVDYVIGMAEEIPDSTAITFAAAFYQQVFLGQPFTTAFDAACCLLPDKDQHLPELFQGPQAAEDYSVLKEIKIREGFGSPSPVASAPGSSSGSSGTRNYPEGSKTLGNVGIEEILGDTELVAKLSANWLLFSLKFPETKETKESKGIKTNNELAQEILNTLCDADVTVEAFLTVMKTIVPMKALEKKLRLKWLGQK